MNVEWRQLCLWLPWAATGGFAATCCVGASVGIMRRAPADDSQRNVNRADTCAFAATVRPRNTAPRRSTMLCVCWCVRINAGSTVLEYAAGQIALSSCCALCRRIATTRALGERESEGAGDMQGRLGARRAVVAVAAIATSIGFGVAPASAQDANGNGNGNGHGPKFSVNATYTTDYRFRGFTQTHEKPALQGGFDVVWPYFYVGLWASSVDFGDVPGCQRLPQHRRHRDDRPTPASSATSGAPRSTCAPVLLLSGLVRHFECRQGLGQKPRLLRGHARLQAARSILA